MISIYIGSNVICDDYMFYLVLHLTLHVGFSVRSDDCLLDLVLHLMTLELDLI